MGVEYDAIGGIGIEVSDELIQSAIDNGLFTIEDYQIDSYECLEKFGESIGEAGSCWTGETEFYLFVKGYTLGDINKNAPAFVKRLGDFGTVVEVDDLQLVYEVLAS